MTRAGSKLRLSEFLPYRLSVAANAVSQVIARAYEETHGLSPQQWRVMAVIAEGGALTQQQIVRRTKTDKVAVSRAAQWLESHKLLRRQQHERDGRALQLTLTAKGRAVYEAVVPRALALEAELLSALSLAERRALTALLRKVEAGSVAELVSDDTF